MNQSGKAFREWRLAAVYAVGIFLFYAAASALVFPLLMDSLRFDRSLDADALATAPGPLAVWSALAYSCTAIAGVLALFAINELRCLKGAARKAGLALFMAGAALSIGMLFETKNASVEALRSSFTLAQGPSDQIVIVAPILDFINASKNVLNTVFQISAVGLLLAFLLHATNAADENKEAGLHNRTSCQFYAAAFLLTLIIITDALFFDFVAAVYPQDSMIVSFQRGMMLYFGVVSTTTLALTLAAGMHLGAPIQAILPAREKNGKLAASLQKAADSAAGSLGKVAATIAPVGVALLTSLLENAA